MRMNIQRLLTLAVVFLLTMSVMFFGCGKAPESSTSFTGDVTEENLTVGNVEDVSITFSDFDIDESETEVVVTKVDGSEFTDDPEISVNAYDFSPTEQRDFISLIDITIPYDVSIINEGDNPSDYVEAFYLNNDVLEPVVFELDEDREVVVITTDHLSKYAVFTYTREYTRKATASVKWDAVYSILFGQGDNIYEKVFPDMLDNNGIPTDVTLEQGFNIVNEGLGISGNALTFITEALHSTEALGKFGNLFTALGVAGAVVQAAYDWQNWENDGGLGFKTNLTKNIGYLSVSIVGSSVAKLCSVGVFCIDYSLNEFGKAAWAGRNDLYKKAYNAYYTDTYPGKKLPRKLYKELYDAYTKSRDNKESFDLKEQTEKLVMTFAGEFWKDESNLPVYLGQVGVTFSGYGGLNQGIIDETTKSYYTELMQTTMQPIFKKLSDKIIFDLRADFQKKLHDVKDELNRKVPILIQETKENDTAEYRYANHLIKFSPLDANTKEGWWSGKLRDDATAKSYFTILGYLQSGAPNKLEIFKPDADMENDEPVMVIDFTFNLGDEELNIDIGSKPPTLDELVGTWDNPENMFTLLNADSDWEGLKTQIMKASEEATQEMVEEYGCDPETVQITPETIDSIESRALSMIGQKQRVIFSIEKVDEITGRMTFVSFPNDSEEQCDSVTGMTFTFTYDNGSMDINYSSLISYLQSQELDADSTMGAIPFRAGNGSLTASWGTGSGGEKAIIIDGNIDYSVKDTSAEIPIDLYINYGIHGAK